MSGAETEIKTKTKTDNLLLMWDEYRNKLPKTAQEKKLKCIEIISKYFEKALDHDSWPNNISIQVTDTKDFNFLRDYYWDVSDEIEKFFEKQRIKFHFSTENSCSDEEEEPYIILKFTRIE